MYTAWIKSANFVFLKNGSVGVNTKYRTGIKLISFNLKVTKPPEKEKHVFTSVPFTLQESVDMVKGKSQVRFYSFAK